jgi:hypothetical protein
MAKGDQTRKIDAFGLDAICDMIEQDNFYPAIAAKIGVSEALLHAWLTQDPERSARANAARARSARYCDHLALVALETITDDAPPGMIARQREIASHYRWRAKKRDPKEFGDRQIQAHEGDVNLVISTGVPRLGNG